MGYYTIEIWDEDGLLHYSNMCDRFPSKFDVQTSYKPSNYVLRLIFVVNIKFPQAIYHMTVASSEELYCLIIILIVFIAKR